jgi:hypothetical protein
VVVWESSTVGANRVPGQVGSELLAKVLASALSSAIDGGSRVLFRNLVRRRRLRGSPSASLTTLIPERLASDSLSTVSFRHSPVSLPHMWVCVHGSQGDRDGPRFRRCRSRGVGKSALWMGRDREAPDFQRCCSSSRACSLCFSLVQRRGTPRTYQRKHPRPFPLGITRSSGADAFQYV